MLEWPGIVSLDDFDFLVNIPVVPGIASFDNFDFLLQKKFDDAKIHINIDGCELAEYAEIHEAMDSVHSTWNQSQTM